MPLLSNYPRQARMLFYLQITVLAAVHAYAFWPPASLFRVDYLGSAIFTLLGYVLLANVVANRAWYGGFRAALLVSATAFVAACNVLSISLHKAEILQPPDSVTAATAGGISMILHFMGTVGAALLVYVTSYICLSPRR